MKIKTLTLILSIITTISYGQKGNVKNSQVGFLLGSLVPVDFFGISAIELSANNSNIKLENTLGYNFGMVLKTDLTRKFSLESGIIFYQRNFELTGSSSNQSIILRDTSSFSYISYGFPIKSIVYVQLGNDFYMRNSIGFNLDFYASAVASNGENFRIDHYSERARWINGSVSGNLGVEKRDDKFGTFYIGTEVNIPISSIAVTRLKFYYDGAIYDNYEPIFLRGNYFGIKLKYYLPVNMESKKADD